MKRLGVKCGAKKLHPNFSNNVPSASEISQPTPTPTTPEISPKNEDSNKNIPKTSALVAPIAFSIPISLYLSRTEVIIVFAVLTAETTIEIKAIKNTKPIMIFRAIPKLSINSS